MSNSSNFTYLQIAIQYTSAISTAILLLVIVGAGGIVNKWLSGPSRSNAKRANFVKKKDLGGSETNLT